MKKHLQASLSNAGIALAFFILLSNTSAGQVLVGFQETFGGPLNEEAYCGVQFNGGTALQQGYTLTGMTNSFGAGGNDLMLMRCTNSGTLVWSRAIGGAGSEEGHFIQKVGTTNAAGYIVAGITNSYGSGGNDMFLVKTNGAGNVTWTRTFGGAGSENATCVRVMPDGSYVVAGSTNTYGQGSDDFYMVKTDVSGNMLWNKTVGGTGSDIANSIYVTSDGGFILTGSTSSFSPSQDIYIVKTDFSGTVQWSTVYGGPGTEDSYSVVQTSDGGYMVSGYTNSFGAGDNDFYLLKLDATGTVTWSKTYGGAASDICKMVNATSDGSYVLSGSTNSYGNGLSDELLIKIDASGNILWTKTYGSTGDEFACSIQETSDGGFIITGYSNSWGSQDFYLVKTDWDGNTSCYETVPVLNESTGGVASTGGVSSTGGTMIIPAPISVGPVLNDSLICVAYDCAPPPYGYFTFYNPNPTNDTTCSNFNIPFVANADSVQIDWGDGSPQYVNVTPSIGMDVQSHTYSIPGTYIINTVGFGFCGNDTLQETFVVTGSPTALFSFNSPDSCVGQTISFTDLSTAYGGRAISWNWNFGDGNTSTLQNPTFTYATPGSYTITLTVTYVEGGCNSSYSLPITIIQNALPLVYSYSQGCPCNIITFNTTGSSINWSFGDATSSTINNLTHVYNSPGEYNVTLTNTETNGCIQYKNIPVSVCPNDTIFSPSKSNYNWAFYNKAGISFSSGVPVAFTSAMGTSCPFPNSENSASISDAETGNLIFYTNGATVWDATHTQMPNGFGLYGSSSSSQGVVIVPFPGDKNKYYIFTRLGGSTGGFCPGGPYGLYYSVVDMTLNEGLGDVVPSQKNTTMLSGSFSETVSACIKKKETCNSPAEYWVVINSNSFQCNIFNAFLVSSAGVNTTPVTSVLSFPISGIGNLGVSAFSPQGNKYIISYYGSAAVLLNFDISTGLFSKPDLIPSVLGDYSSGFSPNGRYVYVSTNPNKLIQYDVTAANPSATGIQVGSGVGFMWQGPDNKIYAQRGANLGVINNPDIGGVGCGFTTAGPSPGGAALQNMVHLYPQIIDTSFADFTANTTNCLDVSFNNLVTPPHTDVCSWLYNNDTLTYQWNFGDGSPLLVTNDTSQITHSYATGGTYPVSLTVTRPFMCTTNTLTKNSTVNIPPSPSITGTTTICSGNSTTLTASGGSTYSWSTAATSTAITVSPTNTTTYTVTVANGGCTGATTVVVTVNQNPVISVSPSAICAGGTSILTATGGTSYVWSTSETTTTISVSPIVTTSYSLTATTAGCSTTASATVIVGAAIVPVITGDTIICNGSSTTLTTAGGTYLWSTSETTSAITVFPTITTTYTVMVTNGSCSGSVSQRVTVKTNPIPVIAGTTTICTGSSTTLTASGGNTYSWSTTATSTAITVSPTIATTYTVTATNTGCTGATTVSVAVNSNPTPSITGTTTICSGNSTTLTANGGGTYSWSTTETTTVITVSPISNTTYTVTATNAGCTGTTTVAITVKSNPSPSITGTTAICTGNSTTLTASGGSTYSWSTTATSTAITVSPTITTTYTVIATNIGCTGMSTVVVNVGAIPDISIAPPAELNCTATNIVLTGSSSTSGVNYQWTSGPATATHTVTTAGTYTLTVTDPGTGCASQQTVVVNSNTNPPDISITPPTQLTCTNTNETLTGNSTTAGVTYQWAFGPATATYTISAAGTYTLTVTDPANTCTASETVTVTQDGSIPNITITPNEITCINDSVIMQASSSTAGITYQWTGGPADSVYKVGTAGSYTLTATNTLSGCTSTQAVYVNSNTTPPNISIASPAQLNCTNASVTLTGSSGTAGVTYQWTSGSATTTYIVNTAGTYTFTVTDPSNGCTSQQTVAVSSNTTVPDISIIAPAQLTCNTTSEDLTGNSATIGVTYQWTYGPASDTYTVSAAGTYTLTVTDPANGCTASKTVTVTQDGSIPNITITPSEINCIQDSVTIKATSSTPGVTYQWIGGPADSVYTVGAAGNYTLTATNSLSGCTSTQVVYVNSNTTLPNVSIASPATLTCNTTSITLIGSSTSGGVTYPSYQWTGGPTTATYTVSVPATYTLTVTDPNNGCASQQTIVVTSNTTPPPVTVNAASICAGQTAILTASGASTYTWSTGVSANSITVTPVTPTTYTVVGTNTVNGCTNAITAVVSITAPPTAIATGATVCEGETINLTSTGGGTYSWNGPNAFTSVLQNPTLTNSTTLNSGTYTVTVSYSSCSATATALVTVNPTPTTNAGNDVSITMGSSATLTATGGISYIWTPTTGLDCDTCASVIATPTATIVYCVQTSIGTCNSSDCVTITIETPCPSNKDLAVPNAFSPNADGHNDDFCLQGWNACIETFTIFIYDRWGEKVFESEEANFCWDGMFRGKIMDSAVFVYYIKATFTNDEKVVKKGNVSLIK